MPMRKRNRWFIRTGVVCCVLLIAAWVLTIGYTILFFPFDRYICLITGGGIHFAPFAAFDGGFHIVSGSEEIFWLPRLQSKAVIFANFGVKAVFIPFWIPFLMIGVPLAWSIWRSRTSDPPPPTCEHCGYILIGNVSGTCPECGTDF